MTKINSISLAWGVSLLAVLIDYLRGFSPTAQAIGAGAIALLATGVTFEIVAEDAAPVWREYIPLVCYSASGLLYGRLSALGVGGVMFALFSLLRRMEAARPNEVSKLRVEVRNDVSFAALGVVALCVVDPALASGGVSWRVYATLALGLVGFALSRLSPSFGWSRTWSPRANGVAMCLLALFCAASIPAARTPASLFAVLALAFFAVQGFVSTPAR